MHFVRLFLQLNTKRNKRSFSVGTDEFSKQIVKLSCSFKWNKNVNFSYFTADICETIAKEDKNVYDEVPLESKPQKAHGSGGAGCQANRFGCQEDPTGSHETSKDAAFSVFNKQKCSDRKCSGAQKKYENKETADYIDLCDDKIDQVDQTAAEDWYKVPVIRTNDNSTESVYVTMNQIKE